MAAPMKEMPLSVGQKVTASLRGEQYNLAIRGWKVGEYIVVDLPWFGVEPLRLAPQTSCDIYFIWEGILFRFHSTVIYCYFHSTHLMILEYPPEFETQRLRKTDRFKANFPIRYFWEEGGAPEEDYGTIRDISYSGLLISHPRPLKKDLRIFLEAELPYGNISRLEAVVRNIRKNARSQRELYVTGLNLTRISQENREILDKFIESRAVDRRTRPRSAFMKQT